MMFSAWQFERKKCSPSLCVSCMLGLTDRWWMDEMCCFPDRDRNKIKERGGGITCQTRRKMEEQCLPKLQIRLKHFNKHSIFWNSWCKSLRRDQHMSSQGIMAIPLPWEPTGTTRVRFTVGSAGRFDITYVFSVRMSSLKCVIQRSKPVCLSDRKSGAKSGHDQGLLSNWCPGNKAQN